MSTDKTPFPLEGGRVGDGGVTPSSTVTHYPRGHEHPTDAAITRARRQRKEAPLAERRLWAELRKLKLNIRRQAPIGPYIADFAHYKARLVFEVDGYFHTLEENQTRDAKRDEWFRAQGYRVLRIAERDVRDNTEAMAKRIGVYIERLIAAGGGTPPTPALPPSRGKGEER